MFATRGLDSGIGGLVAGQEDRAVLPRAGDGDIAKLFRACLVALRVPQGARPERPSRLPLWTMAQTTARMQQQIGSIPERRALAAFLPRIAADAPDRALRCEATLASTVLAGLKLARNGMVTLEQDQPWQPVRVSQATLGYDKTGVR